jgi:uncharacterized protein YxjI
MSEQTWIPLQSHPVLLVKQIREVAELFGFETRNKYQVTDENDRLVAYAAEQGKGFLGLVIRQFLGHWRSLEFHIFTPAKMKVLTAKQPFRFFFQRLEIYDSNNQFLGAIQQRFSIFTKRFDVQNNQGNVIMEVASPWFKIWTFPFKKGGKQVALIQKKWGGLLTEAFLDKDMFRVEFTDSGISEVERKLVLCASLFVDLRYFETKASS